MPDLQVQCFVKREFQPVFTPENMPRLLYISRREPSCLARPRLLHAHADFAEVMLVHSGSARFLIGDKTYDIQGGDLMIFNSGVVHDELTGAEGAIDSCCAAFAGLHLPGPAGKRPHPGRCACRLPRGQVDRGPLDLVRHDVLPASSPTVRL